MLKTLTLTYFIIKHIADSKFLFYFCIVKLLTMFYSMDKKILIIQVCSSSGAILFERNLMVNNRKALSDFPFAVVNDALDVLFQTIPHDVIFKMQDLK